MTDEQFDKFLKVVQQGFGALNNHFASLIQISAAAQKSFEQLAIAANPAPNYRKPLADYWVFDWESIGAIPRNYDDEGVTAVEWNGRLFTRRSPQNKFKEAVWFSRAIGKDDQDKNKYETLIKFQDAGEAEELPKKVLKAASNAVKQAPAEPRPQPPASTLEQRAQAFVQFDQVRVFGEGKERTWRVGPVNQDFEVWKDPAGIRQCQCSELRELRRRNARAECPHIAAVVLFTAQSKRGGVDQQAVTSTTSNVSGQGTAQKGLS